MVISILTSGSWGRGAAARASPRGHRGSLATERAPPGTDGDRDGDTGWLQQRAGCWHGQNSPDASLGGGWQGCLAPGGCLLSTLHNQRPLPSPDATRPRGGRPAPPRSALPSCQGTRRRWKWAADPIPSFGVVLKAQDPTGTLPGTGARGGSRGGKSCARLASIAARPGGRVCRQGICFQFLPGPT